MAVNTNSVSYMKEYLKHAITFEKNVYVWSNAMRKMNARVEDIYRERAMLESDKEKASQKLKSLKSTNEALLKKNKQDAVKYKKRTKVSMTVMIVSMIVFALLGCGIGAMILNDPGTTLLIPRAIVIPLFAIVMLVVGPLFTGVVPICLGIYIYSKNKASKAENEAKVLSSNEHLKQQESMLKDQIDKLELEWVDNVIRESIINQDQEEIKEQLKIAQRNLDQIYSMNVLTSDEYKNLTAVTTLYEYLETGVCDRINGSGGIYDTYRREKIELERLRLQCEMNETMKDTKRMISREMQQVRETVQGFGDSLREISRTNAEIAQNTAISAAANQQTAEAARWLEWRTRGY